MPFPTTDGPAWGLVFWSPWCLETVGRRLSPLDRSARDTNGCASVFHAVTPCQVTCGEWRAAMQFQVPSVWTRLCRLRWRWWAISHSLPGLSFDATRRLRSASVESAGSSAPVAVVMRNEFAGSGAGPSGGGSSSSSGSATSPSPAVSTSSLWGGGRSRRVKPTAMKRRQDGSGCSDGHALPPAKRTTLGRLDSVQMPVPRTFHDAKATYIRRAKVDRDVGLIFSMVTRPQLQVRATEYLVSIGVEARDCLQRLARVDLTHGYYVNAVLREINDVAMVQHVRDAGAKTPTAANDARARSNLSHRAVDICH